MPKPLFKSPECLVTKWPEVFEDLYINSLPIDYVDLIKFEFTNGRQWIVNLKENLNNDIKTLESMILESVKDFEDEISNLEFSIDIIKLKKDITDQSKNIF